MKHKLQGVFILMLAFLFIGFKGIAQVSEKGVPASFAFGNTDVLRAAKTPYVTPIQFDVAKLKAEDKVFEENNAPLRTAIIIPAELDMNSGEWATLPDGRQIWTLTINAPNAIAITLYYDQFIIPEGGKLFIYNEDHSHVIGAFTSRSNPLKGAFATEFVAGDKITLEYDAPSTLLIPVASRELRMVSAQEEKATPSASPSSEAPQLKITGIGYGYNYLKVIRRMVDVLRIGESSSCEVNINCPEGANWQNQKKGVATSITPIGTGAWLCSGTLINNVRQDMTPFFMTASHCFYDTSGATLTATQWAQIQYQFHYESPTCELALPTNVITVVGAQMLVESRLNGGSDGVLLKLNTTITLDENLYFNGWDRSTTAPTSGVGIHHPSGDVMKISTYGSKPVTTSTAHMSGGEIGETNAHWLLYYDQTQSNWGQVEGGSSGSPLFNQNGLVVGTLTGGNSSCANLTGSNIYGKFSYHWTDANNATAAGVDKTKTLAFYLDPDNTGATSINGTYTLNNLPVADFTASATNIYVLESVTYTNKSVSAPSLHWTFEGGTPATFNGPNPPPVQYLTAGDFTTTLINNQGTGPAETKTTTIHVTLKGETTPPVADFSFGGSPTTTVAVAAPLTPTDQSTGTPVLWDWSFPGATPSTATGPAPVVKYMAPGTYNVTLKVTNTIGTNTKTVTGAITVVDQQPVIDFVAASAGAYTMQANFGPYTIPGKTVNFTDSTKNYPTSWNWTFNGGTPGTSTAQNPQGIMYSAVGVYDVTLAATNTAGTISKTFPGFVKANFNDPTRIWNLMRGESDVLYSYNSQPIFGFNSVGFSSCSERFDAPLAGGYVSKVDIKALRVGTGTGSITISVYTDNNGLPGTLLGTSASVNITSFSSTGTIGSQPYVTATFTTPVYVTGPYHIVIGGLTSTRNISVGSAIAQPLRKNTAYIYYSNVWYAAPELFTDLKTSLDVVPYFAYSANTNVDFTAGPAYLLKSNSYLYIPTYLTLNFKDKSVGYLPNAWNWTFTGGVPAASTVQNPQVEYDAQGTYNVALSVTNDAGGTGSLTKTGYVTASAYNVYNTIWNLPKGDLGNASWTLGTGIYLFGQNSYGTTQVAERFDAPAAGGKINAVDISFVKITGTASGTITVTINKEEGGLPGTVLATQTLAASTITASAVKTIDFSANPVPINGAFFVVVSGWSGTASGGIRAVVVAASAARTDGINTAWIYGTNSSYWLGWNPITDILMPPNDHLSLNIAPHFAYTSDIAASFSAQNGYTRQLNYGQFIPTDANINFLDQTQGVPTAWNWTFTGGTPAASTVTNPQGIAYHTDGEYDVELNVTNLAHISSDMIVPNYVKVGYDVPDKVWNMLTGDAGSTLLTSGTDYKTGSNQFGDIAFAERFDAPLVPGYFSSVDIRFTNTSASGSLTVSVQKEIAGEPGPVLATTTLPTSSIVSGAYTTVTFANPVYTDGAYYIVVSGFNQFAAGSIGINSSATLSPTANNTAFVLHATNSWSPVLSSNSLSLNIAPTFTYFHPSFTVAGNLAVDRKNIDATVETVTVTSNTPWTATSTANWVTFVNGSANSNGTFTYTVADNTTPYPRLAKIIVAPTGLESLQQIIIVRQASTFPVGLTAAWEGTSVRANWTALVLNAPATIKLSAVDHSKAVSSKIDRTVSNEMLTSLNNGFVSKTALRSMLHLPKTDRLFATDESNPTNVTVPSENTVTLQKNNLPPMAKSLLRSTPTESVIRWDDGNNSDAIGYNDAFLHRMEVGALFLKTDLLIPSGISSISQVEIYIYDLPLNGITLKIRQGNLLYQQQVSNTQLAAQSFNTITLTTPFVIDNNSDLYIGYEFSFNGGTYVPGIDAGPAVVGKGDLVSDEGGPLVSLTTATGGGINGNWNIAVVVKTGTFDHYGVYRDNASIGQATTPTYLDTQSLSFGDHCYQVTAIYDGLESTRSAQACVFKSSPANSLFTVSPSQLSFAAIGGNKTLTLTINDPMDYINTYGLQFHVDNLPTWISYTVTGNTIVFTASANTTGSIQTGNIHVWLGDSSSSFDTTSGYTIPVSQAAQLSGDMFNYSPASGYYTGTAKTVGVSLKAAYSGIGTITVLYNGSTVKPVNAGDYQISINVTAGTVFDAATNLNIGVFSIFTADLTIRPDDASRLYGMNNPNFTYTITGLEGNDSPASLGNFTVTTTATVSSLPGTYPITANGAQNPNYTITYEDGTLTIGKLDQTIIFPDLPIMQTGNQYLADASASSGLAVSYTSSDPTIADVANDGTITAIAEGTATITASQAGNAIYNPVQIAQDVTVIFLDRTGINHIASQVITVYPNPVTKSTPVYVSADLDEALLADAVITVYDATGLVVKNVKVTGKLTKIDLSVIPGTYILTLKEKGHDIKNLRVIVK